MRKSWFLFTILTLAGSQMVMAEGKLDRIPEGASPKEVRALMGDPIDRIELEVKREQLWIYNSGSVVFVKGKASSIYIGNSDDDILSVAHQQAVAAAKPAAAQMPASPVEDIISEILREVPSEGGEGTAGPPVAPGEMRPVDVTR